MATTNGGAAVQGTLCPQDVWDIQDVLEDAKAIASIMVAACGECVQISSGTVQRLGGMLSATLCKVDEIIAQAREAA